MNWQQISGILRHILTFGGGFLVAKGWISDGVMLDIVGAIITIGGVIWSMINKTPNNMVANAAALPEVQSIKLEQSAPIEMAAPANVSK